MAVLEQEFAQLVRVIYADVRFMDLILRRGPRLCQKCCFYPIMHSICDHQRWGCVGNPVSSLGTKLIYPTDTL